MSITTSQGSFVKTEDVRRLLEERRTVLEAEFKAEPHLPYRMSPERARRAAMRDESLREAHTPGRPLEPTRSVPAGPSANEGVKS